MVWYPECLLENRKDTGYGYIICLGSFLARAVLFSLVYSSGIYYVEILNDLKTSKSSAAWVGSALIASTNMASIASSALLNRYGARLTCAFSAVIASFGFISSVFATSAYYLFLSYGVIAGLGLGLAIIPIIVSINDYFDKWKHIAQSTASTGSSFGAFVGPLLIERLITYYGWRGSILVSSALVLNIGVMGLLMRPFHESHKLRLMCVQRSTVNVKVMNWSIFRNKGFVTICFASASVSFATSVIFVHLSAYAQLDVGISPQKAALLVALIGIMGVPSRLAYGAMLSRNVSPFAVTTTSSFVIGIMTIALPFIGNFAGLAIYSLVVGMFNSASGGAVWPALLTELLGEKTLSNSMGSMNFVCALGVLAGPPFAGWLVDQFGTYTYSFVTAGSLALFSTVLNIIVWRGVGRSNQGKRCPCKHETLLVVERETSL